MLWVLVVVGYRMFRGTNANGYNGCTQIFVIEELEAVPKPEGQEYEDAGPGKKETPPTTKKPRRDKDEEEGDDGKFRIYLCCLHLFVILHLPFYVYPDFVFFVSFGKNRINPVSSL